jgi:hypothetical protein
LLWHFNKHDEDDEDDDNMTPSKLTIKQIVLMQPCVPFFFSFNQVFMKRDGVSFSLMPQFNVQVCIILTHNSSYPIMHI